jgi:hypothetical protein
MKKNTKKPSPADEILSRSEMIKVITQAAVSLLPKDTKLSKAALGQTIDATVQVLESAALRMGEQLASQLVQNLVDEKLIGSVTRIADALVLRAADQIAEKIAAQLADKKFIGAVASQVAALQGKPQPAKGKRIA